MIPLQLTLKNFLSYRAAQLDFRELQTACVCGANGAGKSSLLEAIAWSLWGNGRTGLDETIHAGADEARVDFVFVCDRQTYRVSRSRRRNKDSQLEFQVQLQSGRFRSLTAKRLRDTQDKITTALHLDYETFVNSAYLRQGRADEFMLRTAQERKEVLATLLKLDRYEELAEQAKDAARQFKGRSEQIDQERQHLATQIAARAAVEHQQKQVASELKQLQKRQQATQAELQALQARAYERQNWQQLLAMQQQQDDNLLGDSDRLNRDIEAIAQQSRDCQQLLTHRAEITAAYQQWQEQQAALETLAAKLQADRALAAEIRQQEDQLRAEATDLDRQIQQHEHQLASLAQQARDLAAILSRADEIAAAVAQLQQHRQHLAELDALKLQVAPLQQRRTAVQVELERASAQRQAKLEQWQAKATELRQQQQRAPALQAEWVAVQAKVEALRNQQVYLDRVHEKGNQRRERKLSLEHEQSNCTQQSVLLQQKLDLLQAPSAACPLCDRPLDTHHHARVREKIEAEQVEMGDRAIEARGQLAACERELKALRQEYKTIRDAVAQLDALCQQQGQLEAQLAGCDDIEAQIQQCEREQRQLEAALAAGDYAPELQAEAAQLDRDLAALDYDEQTHSLARGAVDRWRKAEFEQLELTRAQRSQAQLTEREPQIQAQLAATRAQRQQLMSESPAAAAIARRQAERTALAYDPEQHETLQKAVRDGQTSQLSYHQLQQAEAELPELQARQAELQQAQQQRQVERERVQAAVERLTAKLAELPDCQAEIAALEAALGDRQAVVNEHLAKQGALQQQLVQFDAIAQRCAELQDRLQAARRHQQVYQELSQAFGKNGIQALMIENVLPQLEAQTNQILARLSDNQLHVQFLTQKATKTKSRKQATKFKDTLEILIADARGTRPYETYSGGEAFRINFAIRLALARLLAQRAGASLQMLIIDEGFGTQDVAGCDRLIAAINAIADDFACILTVTHMPQFKEAFQTRIEVQKTPQGSQLEIIG